MNVVKWVGLLSALVVWGFIITGAWAWVVSPGILPVYVPRVPASAPVAAPRRASGIDPCERPYRERMLEAEKRMNAEQPALNAIKDAGGRMTDSAAWGRWVAASSDESVARTEMGLRCH